MSTEAPNNDGTVEGFLHRNLKRSLFILGGLAAAAIILPPIGAIVASNGVTGAGLKAIGGKPPLGHLK